MSKKGYLCLFFNKSYSKLGNSPDSIKFLSSVNGRKKFSSVQLPINNELYLLTCALLERVF